MTAIGIPTNAKQLAALVKKGEGLTLECKRSTAEIQGAMQSLCAFLNGSGGIVIIGVGPDGRLIGQDVSDATQQKIAAALDRFEPPAPVQLQIVELEKGKQAIVLKADADNDSMPFTFEGRSYERVGTTTRRMPQAKYERTLFDRAHGKRRWESEPAGGIELRDIDREEVFRVVEAAKSAGRLIGPVGTRLADVLDRLKLRRNGKLLQAAVVLFGKEFLPDYPQCELRMARFRGIDKTEFLDQRNVRESAFKLLEEAQLFCQRHFPLPGKIVPGKLQRVDTPLIPPDAMREILVNALIHRDYSIAGGAISLAIFDDRVEVWSAGTYPTGITPEKLSKSHQSVQRNPLIADVFYKTGLIEKWGRGTNRVIEMCLEADIAPPKFEEITGAAVVTFKVNVRGPQQTTDQLAAQLETETGPSLSQVCPKSVPSDMAARLLILSKGDADIQALMRHAGQTNRTRFRNTILKPLIECGLLEPTIPDKPRSSKQKYRLTAMGREILEKEGLR